MKGRGGRGLPWLSVCITKWDWIQEGGSNANDSQESE